MTFFFEMNNDLPVFLGLPLFVGMHSPKVKPEHSVCPGDKTIKQKWEKRSPHSHGKRGTVYSFLRKNTGRNSKRG